MRGRIRRVHPRTRDDRQPHPGRGDPWDRSPHLPHDEYLAPHGRETDAARSDARPGRPGVAPGGGVRARRRPGARVAAGDRRPRGRRRRSRPAARVGAASRRRGAGARHALRRRALLRPRSDASPRLAGRAWPARTLPPAVRRRDYDRLLAAFLARDRGDVGQALRRFKYYELARITVRELSDDLVPESQARGDPRRALPPRRCPARLRPGERRGGGGGEPRTGALDGAGRRGRSLWDSPCSASASWGRRS